MAAIAASNAAQTSAAQTSVASANAYVHSDNDDDMSFDKILASQNSEDDEHQTHTDIPTQFRKTMSGNGASSHATSILRAHSHKLLSSAKPLTNLKVVTPSQANQLAGAAQPQSQQPSATAQAAIGASNSEASDSGGFFAQIGHGLVQAVDFAADVISGQPEPATAPTGVLGAVQVVSAGSGTSATAQAQSDAATIAATDAQALQTQASGQSAAALDALKGVRITAAKNPTAAQLAASKAQAIADLKPATPTQMTETQALRADAGSASDKADTKDSGAQSGNGKDGTATQGGASASGSSSTTTSGSQTFQAASTAQQGTAQAQPSGPSATGATNATANAAATNASVGGVTGLNAATSASLQVSAQSEAQQAAAQPDINALAVSIAAKSVEGAKQFDIRLDPPDLGRVDVKLSVDTTGKAQAHLTVEKPQTLDMLQRDSGSLQRSLKESGVDLSNNGLQFSLKGQQQQDASAQRSTTGSRTLSVSAVASTDSASSTNYGYAQDRARLDIRV